MAKKNKQQKRKEKLKTRKVSQQNHQNQIQECFVDKNKIELAFPNVQERLNYVRALQEGL